MTNKANFVAIDFETANSERSSACSIGYAIVENGEIVKTGEHLIKPEPFYFDGYNTYLHGIDEEMVSNKSNIVETWNELYPYFKEKIIVAHNASFDMSVLRCGFDAFSVDYPNLNYICTYKLSEKTWINELNYKLDTLAEKFDIEFRHHNAEEDAIVSAKILLNILNTHDVTDIEGLLEKLKLKTGKLLSNTYNPFSTRKRTYKNIAKELVATTDEFNEDNEFFEKKVIFTGTLQSMTRKEASQMVLDVGGILGNGVTKDTDFLILGEQDYRVLKGGKMSSKMKKAYKYHEEGTGIQIISEDDFLKMIGE
ncbi:TPA: 3'-5' exoribonuclease [Clostridioides difficile]|uniref:exonuclease domain-containing protein n=1 Tax=Clostridioides difficile TaxID=1496 RepID=UPI00097FFDEE|nr:exonuclease domain-containing protein [Clostridioides difficile]SJX14419.1 exonuclease RNase T and DNA polymerase III [Clostridioides difficile]HDF2960442.1 3'-5' exoribonuclease [Clostridioides difficile]